MTTFWIQKPSDLQPWEFDVRVAPYNKAFKEAMFEMPGARFEQPAPGKFGPTRWVIPEDLMAAATQVALDCKLQVVDHRGAGQSPGWAATTSHSQLIYDAVDYHPRFPQQWTAATDAARRNAWLFNFSMGLGKTWAAIAAMRLRNVRRAIVIAPAMAREVWLREIEKFWPDYSNAPGQGRPRVKVLRDSAQSVRGRKRLRTDVPDGEALAAFAAGPDGIIVLSYGLLHVLQPLLDAGLLAQTDAIIADEAHYLQNPKAQWTKQAFALRDSLPRAWRAGLTGTAVTNNVDSMHTPLDWLFPQRFGTFKSFRWTFMNPVPKQSAQTGEVLGWDYKGKEVEGGMRKQAEIDAALATLRERLAFVSSRVTKRDVAHLLPPFSVQRYDSADVIKDSVDLCGTALSDGETTHIRLMCYTHANADTLQAALHKAFPEIPVAKVMGGDGGHTAKQRDDIIERLKTQKTAILVATISSTKEAIDLTKFSTAIYAELSPKLVENIQSLGRGHRLSSTQKADVHILADKRGDTTARAMADKLEVLNSILRAGTEEGQLQMALQGLKDAQMSDAEYEAVTAAILSNFFDDAGDG